MNTYRIRYKQRDFHLKEIDKFTNIDWCLEKYGCGPTSIANILKNYGFDSADKIKNTILKWCSDEKRGIFENYDSITGRGMFCDCFSWSAAFIIEFILNF